LGFLGLGNVFKDIDVTEIKETGKCVDYCPEE
jgi:hypothetical protein